MFEKLQNKKNRSISTSLPKEYELYGVKIKKLPVAKYLKVLEAIDDLPALLVGKAFDGQNVKDVAAYLLSLDQPQLIALIGRLLTIVPEQLCRVLSELLDIPRERLLEDTPDALGLNEMTQVILAFWEMNDLSDFFATVRRVIKPSPRAQTTGSSAGLPSDKASA